MTFRFIKSPGCRNEEEYIYIKLRQGTKGIYTEGQSAEILNTFLDDEPVQKIYMIAGVLGSGKAVFMTDVARQIREEGDWK